MKVDDRPRLENSVSKPRGLADPGEPVTGTLADSRRLRKFVHGGKIGKFRPKREKKKEKKRKKKDEISMQPQGITASEKNKS